jgi:hypothetical protein
VSRSTKLSKTLVPVVLALLLAPASAAAAERKPFAAVSAPLLLRETQRQENNDRNVMLVWWIPYEFWQVSTANAGESQRSGIAQLEPVLTPYTILMVVDGRVLPLGSMSFANREQLAANLRVETLSPTGEARPMTYLPEPPPQVQAVLGSIRPMLAGNLGELGKNMQLFVYSNQGADGKALLSPYSAGGLRVTLTPFTPVAPEGSKPLLLKPAQFDFETPLDALHVARLCANGKPAHISWRFCPWDGKKPH